MHSLRTKSILLNVTSIVVAIGVVATISAISIANFGHRSTEQTLMLQCESGKNNINYYFKSTEQSLDSIKELIDEDLSKISDSDFSAEFSNHVNRAGAFFKNIAEHTNGILTYYYRMDPEISNQTGNELGFWYVNLDGKEFVSHQVTDLTDESKSNPWYQVPKEQDKPVWVPPYYTTGLDNVYVVSYNVPIKRGDTFIGVAGIELGYETFGEQIENIIILESGYSYIVESTNGTIIYHPHLDLRGLSDEERPPAPVDLLAALKGDEHHFKYHYNGTEKHGYWLNLSNDMTIIVAVPTIEIARVWSRLLIQIIVVAIALIAVVSVLTILYTRKITKPLNELTNAAKRINEGDYKVDIDYRGDDEIGILTSTVNQLVKHLDEYISDLNALAHSDSLTDVQNKSSFDEAIRELQARMDRNDETLEFAIAIFDCDDLKEINDNYGHDKGNIVLVNSSNLMRRVFKNSVIYRLGGDEFAAILENDDYQHREELRETFIKKSAEICSFAKEPWEEIHASIGVAAYEPDFDGSVKSVIVHADHLMYEDKRQRKKNK